MSNWIAKDGYDTKVLATADDLSADGVEIQLVRFHKGKFEHYHKLKTEFFHFTAGAGKVLVNGNSQPLSPGISLLIRPGERHTFINESATQTLEAIMFKTNNDPEDTYQ